jgi:hypothetical protein
VPFLGGQIASEVVRAAERLVWGGEEVGTKGKRERQRARKHRRFLFSYCFIFRKKMRERKGKAGGKQANWGVLGSPMGRGPWLGPAAARVGRNPLHFAGLYSDDF